MSPPLPILDVSLHDTTDFPLVYFRGDLVSAGYGANWCAEMDVFINANAPFVLIYPKAERDEGHEDRKIRGAWLKKNKRRLAGICLALIVVEPDATRRAALEAIFPSLVRAFGTPQTATASLQDAQSLARRLLAREALDAR